MTFALFDKVKLISGGPTMEIICILEDNVICADWSKQVDQFRTFSTKDLVKIK